MSYRTLLPTLIGRDWWDMWDYPSRIMDQHFGNHLCDIDLLTPTLVNGLQLRPRTQANIAASGKSEVRNNDNQFEISLNVNQFKPEELEVKIVDNYIVIHGKHEEKSDDHGFVSREFTRRYMLPKSCDMNTVSSSINSKGTLTVSAPKKAIEEPPKQERAIPISSSESVKDST